MFEGAWQIQGGLQLHHRLSAHFSSGKRKTAETRFIIFFITFHRHNINFTTSVLDVPPEAAKNLWIEMMINVLILAGQAGERPRAGAGRPFGTETQKTLRCSKGRRIYGCLDLFTNEYSVPKSFSSN